MDRRDKLAEGKDLREKYDFSGALSAFEQHLASYPDSDEGWACKAEILFALGRCDEGLSAADKAIALNRNLAFSWVSKSANLLGLKRYEEALSATKEAFRLDRNARHAWHYRGVVLYELKKYESALAAFEEQLRENPDGFGAAWYKALTLEALGQHSEAVRAYNRAVEMENQNPACHLQERRRRAQLIAMAKKTGGFIAEVGAGVLADRAIDSLSDDGGDKPPKKPGS